MARSDEEHFPLYPFSLYPQIVPCIASLFHCRHEDIRLLSALMASDEVQARLGLFDAIADTDRESE